MNLIKPKKLKQGDCIALLSACGCVNAPEKLDIARKYFESRGFKVKLQDSFSCVDYLGGTDFERKTLLESLFKDDDVDAILNIRGGYGALRIIELLDYEIIRSNPKIFAGFSDITAFLLMMYKKTGLVTFHSPMVLADFVEPRSAFTESSFFDVLQNGSLLTYKSELAGKPVRGSVAEGVLFGGNLSTLASLCGLDFVPDDKFILFIEDINEPAYKIDRMLTQLLNISKFRVNLAGIVVGEFVGLDSDVYLGNYFGRLADEINKPICCGFKITHGADKITLPVGVKCKLDADTGELTLLEGYFND